MRSKELALENSGQERLTKAIIDFEFIAVVKVSEADKKAKIDKENKSWRPWRRKQPVMPWLVRRRGLLRNGG